MTGNAEIVVPKSQALEELSRRLTVLKNAAAALAVTDQPTYVAAAGLRTSFKAYLDAVKFQVGPEITATKEKLDRLKQDASILLDPGKAELDAIDAKMLAFREEEKRAARVEEERINAENRRKQQEQAEADRRESERIAAETKAKKVAEINAFLKAGKIGKREAARQLRSAGAAAEAAMQDIAAIEEDAKNAPPPTVKVKPNVPNVAGAPKNQTFYYGEIENPERLWVAFATAIKNDNVQRVTFLSRFFEVNNTEIGKFARETKDNEKAAEAVPGAKFWSKG